MTAFVGALLLETRVQARYGIIAVAALLTVLWTAVLLAVPAGVARSVAPLLLLVDTATFGALLIAGLLLFERTEGSRSALAVTPLSTVSYLAAKLVSLTSLSVLSAVPILLAATRGEAGALPQGLVGVALATLLFLAIPLSLAARSVDLMRFLVLVPIPVVPLLLVPLAYQVGLLEHPGAFVVPTTATMELLRHTVAPETTLLSFGWLAASLIYLTASCVVLGAVALRQLRAEFASPPPRATMPAATPSAASPSAASHERSRPAEGTSERGGGGVFAALVRIDAAGVGRDLVLVVFVAAPILLALALRFGYAPAVDYVDARFGVDLAPHLPVALAVLVLLHVALMVGSVGALRLIEDADDGTLLVLRASPASLTGYFAYRLGVTSLAAVGGLAIAVPLSGLAPGGWDAQLLVAAGLSAAQAPLVMLAVTATAGNKVEALAVLKLGGGVMLLPVLIWSLPGTTAWLLAWLPPFWAAQAALGTPAAPLWGSVAAGVVLTTAMGAALLRRTTTRLTQR